MNESNVHLGEGNGNQLQCSCLENLMDRGAWWAIVHGVANSRTRLGDFTFSTSNVHLTRMKEESEKAGLKLNIQKTKIMASIPITS